MQRTVWLDKKGVSLVEMMIALVILLLVFLALMQTALVSIDSNVRNILRDDAVSIAEQRMTTLRNTPFNNLTAGIQPIPPEIINRAFRDMTIPFSYQRSITDLDPSNKQITITVSWTWKGETFTHTVNSIKRNLW